jgi:hypothetical protein
MGVSRKWRCRVLEENAGYPENFLNFVITILPFEMVLWLKFEPLTMVSPSGVLIEFIYLKLNILGYFLSFFIPNSLNFLPFFDILRQEASKI